jgi:hypothetical protein
MFLRMASWSMIAACGVFPLASPVFAQSSAPVTSSVFTHQATDDTGGESGAINDNWKFITNPPARPVAASEPAPSNGARHGKRGRGMAGSGGMADTGAASAGTSTSPPSNMPLAPAMPVNPPVGPTGNAQ